MGSCDCLRRIIIRKRLKKDRSKQGKKESNVGKESSIPAPLSEDIAATRIQAFFKGYLTRKCVGGLKGIARYHSAMKPLAAENQQLSALKRIHFWAKIQAELNARRLYMVTEGRRNQKKLENKLKLKSKIHEVEDEWSNGSETMEKIIQRIQQREEAAAKRERAMAYAFSHQWKANSTQYFGHAYYDMGKDSWGWSWKERWVAVRPWEMRVQSKLTNLNKIQADKSGKSKNTAAIKIKPPLIDGRYTIEPIKLATW